MTLDTTDQDIDINQTDTYIEEVATQAEIPPYVLVSDPNPFAAVGRAAGMLQPFPNFALLPFGQINALIIGAVNRGHYHFLLKDGQPVGFFAWALAGEAAAETWLKSSDPSEIGDGTQGDCVVFNIWHVSAALKEDAAARKFLIRSFREMFADKKKLLARRVYASGRVKPIRIQSRNT